MACWRHNRVRVGPTFQIGSKFSASPSFRSISFFCSPEITTHICRRLASDDSGNDLVWWVIYPTIRRLRRQYSIPNNRDNSKRRKRRERERERERESGGGKKRQIEAMSKKYREMPTRLEWITWLGSQQQQQRLRHISKIYHSGWHIFCKGSLDYFRTGTLRILTKLNWQQVRLLLETVDIVWLDWLLCYLN